MTIMFFLALFSCLLTMKFWDWFIMAFPLILGVILSFLLGNFLSKNKFTS